MSATTDFSFSIFAQFEFNEIVYFGPIQIKIYGH